MNLKEDLLHTVPKKTYLEYLKLQIRIRGEKTKEYSAIILSLAALSFFGLFVINPTLSTITVIRKQLTDAKLLNEKLEKKIKVLDSLENQYNRLETGRPLVFNAVTTDPQVIPLLGKIETLSRESNLTIVRLDVSKVELTKSEGQGSFLFSVRARGVYSDMEKFLDRVVAFDRIITLEEVSISKEDSPASLLNENIRVLQMSGRAYFKT